MQPRLNRMPDTFLYEIRWPRPVSMIVSISLRFPKVAPLDTLDNPLDWWTVSVAFWCVKFGRSAPDLLSLADSKSTHGKNDFHFCRLGRPEVSVKLRSLSEEQKHCIRLLVLWVLLEASLSLSFQNPMVRSAYKLRLWKPNRNSHMLSIVELWLMDMEVNLHIQKRL